ncbi:MAG: hypothetical protein AAB592_03165, partial [Patescibacteria group bacterium]
MSRRRGVRERPSFGVIGIVTKRILLGVAVLAVIIGGIYLVSFSSFFTIKTVRVLQDDVPIEQPIFQPLSDAYLGKNLIFITPASLEREIIQQFPQMIATAEVHKRYPGTLVVSFTNFPLEFNVLTESEKDGQVTQKKVVINSEGFVMEEDMEYPGLASMKVSIEEA